MPDLESQSLSRRSMLKGTAGAGAAGLAIGALAGAIPASAATTALSPKTARTGAEPGEEASEASEVSEAIVVHVRDAAAGDIEVYRGTTQIQLRDRALAARIVRASR